MAFKKVKLVTRCNVSCPLSQPQNSSGWLSSLVTESAAERRVFLLRRKSYWNDHSVVVLVNIIILTKTTVSSCLSYYEQVLINFIVRSTEVWEPIVTINSTHVQVFDIQ